ncbi:MAG: glucose-1-phosphate adenylyltransferase [Lutibacter sp.]|jgi:glucose-1-phosphate adenylyltransferase|uniref:glucose-1-phosphate adenylyltransferase n=1 Tax=Lutibacter sp. TaxID=1925666 RepID=UPI00299EDF96|nr:glucose-1-phosphate adenylyltransferase [Lutibacter sp.]MDX1828023.1 glucose-1-phosphate adenylyltransferase [Lutibacter sp.]
MINDKVLAIILGGGQGSRLYPLTHARSKPAVSIAGKYRLVDIPISNCINSDIKRMYVLTQFNSASLNRHIKNTYHFSFFSSAFVDVLAAEQTPTNHTWFQGTADAVRQSMHHFNKHNYEYVLILSGDQLYQMDFKEMVNAHIKSKAEISIATIPVNEKEAPSFGILKSDENNFISSFIEKPDAKLLPDWTSEVSDEMKAKGKNYLASMGIYIFNKGLLKELMSNPDTIDFGKEIIPQAIEKHPVLSYQYEGYWTDIGTIESFFEANLGLTDKFPEFDLYSKAKRIYTHPRMLPTTKISGTNLDRTVIAEGCIIDAGKIEHSVIGVRSKIDKESTIINTYMMGSDYYQSIDEILDDSIVSMGIGKRCFIKNAILDKNCCIGNDVRINGGNHLKDVETDTYVVREGIVVVKKGAVLPNGFII